MAKGTQLTLLQEFDAAFTAPYTLHRWASARARSHWLEFEILQDAIAGPLWAIAHSGGCGYVYLRNDSYFAGVNNPATLRSRLLEWHAALVAEVEQFAPATPAEVADLTFMRAVLAEMLEVVEIACEIETARWTAEGGGV